MARPALTSRGRAKRAHPRYNETRQFEERGNSRLKKNSAVSPASTGEFSPDSIAALVQTALDDAKASDVETIDVRGKTTVTDYMIVASGNSTRHVKTLAESVVMASKKSGIEVLGVEGETESEWILVDLAHVLVHLMLPRTRTFYNLESLWSVDGEAAAG